MPIADGVKGITVTEQAFEALRTWSFWDKKRRTQQELASLAISRMAASAADELLVENRKAEEEQTTKKGETDNASSG